MLHTKKINQWIIPIAASVLLTACAPKEKKEIKKTEPVIDNILLKEWEGPYGGVPAFDSMKLEDVKPALLQGMEMNLTDIEAIANNNEAPTFENTIVEMERAGAPLNRAFNYYGILSGNMSSPEFREIQAEMAPKFSEFQSKINLYQLYYERC